MFHVVGSSFIVLLVIEKSKTQRPKLNRCSSAISSFVAGFGESLKRKVLQQDI